jgi:hypothetical protein
MPQSQTKYALFRLAAIHGVWKFLLSQFTIVRAACKQSIKFQLTFIISSCAQQTSLEMCPFVEGKKSWRLFKLPDMCRQICIKF